MAYCGPARIPHSWFLGGEYRWTESDREKALAWQELDRQTCRRCGTRPDEWKDNRYAYHTAIRVCSGCEVMERGETEFNDPALKKMRGKQLIMVQGPPNAE